jgi:hypothetical protein
MGARRSRTAGISRSAFAGFCFPPQVLVPAVRWYLRFALSYRNVEELLAERGIQVDHTIDAPNTSSSGATPALGMRSACPRSATAR